MTKLKTKEFTLRPPKLTDAQMLLDIEVDKENIKNMMTYTTDIKDIKKSIKKSQAQFSRKKPTENFFIIDTKEGPAGYVSIHDLNKENREHKAAISYALHPDFRGKGLMTKAVKELIKYFFKKFNLKRIEARCRSFNKASARVLEKSGFTFEGIHKKDVKKNGKYLDNMYWGLVR